ncbi:MAG TPA: ATP-binding protein [Blastocatellia bacterium]|nr:ATP-binding protein [Blastocatellia bacterium]
MTDPQRELIEGLLQFVNIAEGERKLLAADLHDQTLSDLRETARLARRLLELPPDAMSEDVRAGLQRIVAELDTTVDEVRRAMENLSPSALDALGLIPAIESCINRIAGSFEPRLDSRLACYVKEEQIELAETEQLMVYRIVQEALNNIAKHAAARSIEVLITKFGSDLLIRVVDDGCGMSAPIDLARSRGIQNMRYRARLLGARLTWLQATGHQGTVVEVLIPMADGIL